MANLETVKSNAKTESSLDKTSKLLLSWDSAVDWFLQSRRLIGCSEQTIRRYTETLKLFLEWHEDNAPDCVPNTCPKSHIEAFIASRTCRNITKHSYWRVLRTLFYFLMQQGVRTDNPCLGIKIKDEEPMPRTVTFEHLAAVLNALDLTTFAGLRNAALFTLAFDTGARLSELLSFTVGDVIVGKRMVLVRGKGGKDRYVFFGRLTAQILQAYLAEYSKRFPVYPEAPLFVTEDGHPIRHRQSVRQIWTRAQKRANVKVLPFHGLRHGFAKAWLLAGGDLFSLQQLLGHSDISVTRRYVKLLTEDLERLHDKYSPADRLWSMISIRKILRKQT